MSRKAMIEKEKKKKNLVAKYYAVRQECKKIIKSFSATEEDKSLALQRLAKLPRNSSPVRMRNRCQLSGRPRGFYRKFQLSRLCFRELALEGLIPGVIKSSW